MTSGSPWSRSKLRSFLYAATVTVVVLVCANGAVEWLESHEFVQTRTQDDFVQLVDGELLHREGEGLVRTTAYAERSVRPSSFRADGQGSWRLFMLGGSFLMDKPGGIADWLRADLAARQTSEAVEVVNFAAAGQDSFRNLRIAEELLPWGADGLLVATCNNEGNPPPGRVRERLRKAGGYRLMEGLLTSRPKPMRPAFTPQIGEIDLIRQRFVGHVERIVRLARAEDIPVLLATVPANLTYDGLDPLVPPEASAEDRACLRDGAVFLDGGQPGAARLRLSGCADVGEAGAWLGLAELQSGEGTRGQTDLRQRWGDCVYEGVKLYYSGQPDEAISQLSHCDDVAEALRWIGLARRAMDDPEGARQALEASLYLLPRNRCRPSFNDELRHIAATTEGIYLLDLDKLFRKRSDDGLPGRRWFVDTCHLNWQGHELVARAVVEELDRLGLAPGSAGSPPADRDRLVEEWGLSTIDDSGRRWGPYPVPEGRGGADAGPDPAR